MKPLFPRISFGVFAVLLVGSLSLAADWPMWRCDGRRSGTCQENLPAELHVQWTRELPPVMLAWPNESRLHFDACYEPVVAGTTLVLGSPNDGSVTAFDCETGEPWWQFFSEGPVRFAPIAWKEKVYFGSDDGWLYCLALADGKLLWKVRGAPDDCPERRHLGNNRLISLWPVRGGPVLADDTIYFGAGLWPTMGGVFVVAVDAQTGKLRWRNAEVSRLENVRLDHNDLHPSGLSPQGYLVVEGDRLVVPNGRSMPAVLDRATGKLLHYLQGYRNGDCQVTAMGNYALVGQAGVVDLRTGREVGSRWAAAGADAPKAFDLKKFHLFESPSLPYKHVAGCTARSALADGRAYDLHQGTFLAYDVEHAKLAEYDSKIMGLAIKPWRWDPPLLWKLPTELPAKKPADTAILLAGNRLYGHTGKTLMAVDLPAGEDAKPTLAWKQPMAGTAARLLAANGRLFVVTKEGRIVCLGAASGEAKTFRYAATPLAAADEAKPRAAEILDKAGVTEGYCLLLGLGPEGLAEQLLLQSELKLIGVDPDGQRVNRLRARLMTAGLYGTRVELFCGEPRQFALPPYLASLIVAELPAEDESADRFARHCLDVLRPYGGTAYLQLPEGRTFRVPGAVTGQPGAEVAQVGRAVRIRRVGPLPQSAPWTHECADASLTYFSRDRCVRPPLAVLWYGDGPDYGFWKEHDYATGIKPQVIGGRLFALRISSRSLFAYDVYTGRLLWTVKTDPFSRYASMEDGVYLAGCNRCVVHDPATGRPLREFHYEVESGRPTYVTGLRVEGDVIVIGAAAEKLPAIRLGLWDCTALVVLDRKSGQMLWRRAAKDRFHNHAMAVADGTVFAIDSRSMFKPDADKSAGKPQQLPSTILALDARSGKTRWSATTMNRYSPQGPDATVSIRNSDDWLGYCQELRILLTGKGNQTYGFDVRDGKELWHQTIAGSPMILCGEKFLTQRGQPFDVRTGQSLGPALKFTRGGCNYAVANSYLLMLRDRSVSYIDLSSGEKQDLFAIRSGCSNCLIAADGLLNVPNFAVGCVCNYPIQTSFALVPVPADGRQ